LSNQLIGKIQEKRSIKTLKNTCLMPLFMVHHNWRLLGSF
jgi:hypothetical protein